MRNGKLNKKRKEGFLTGITKAIEKDATTEKKKLTNAWEYWKQRT